VSGSELAEKIGSVRVGAGSELTFLAWTRPVGCPCRERSPSRHALSQWASLLVYLQHICCDIASCGSSPTLMGPAWTSSFDTASARTPRLTEFIGIHLRNL